MPSRSLQWAALAGCFGAFYVYATHDKFAGGVQSSVLTLVAGAVGLAVLLRITLSLAYNRTAEAQRLLKPATVTAVLRRKFGPGITVSRVTIDHIARCGDGKASTTDRIAFSLEYSETPTGWWPQEHMILKYILLPRYFRLGAHPAVMRVAWRLAQLLSWVRLDWVVYSLINMYNYHLPHAPDAMYENETRFYRDVRPELDAETETTERGGSGAASVKGAGPFEAPEVYGTLYDAPGNRYGVFMQDLSRKGASFPNALDELPLASLRSVLRQLARLHARFWQSPRLASAPRGQDEAGGGDGDGDLAWLPTPTKGGMFEVFHSLGYGLIADHVRSNAFEQELLAPLRLPVPKLWLGLCRAEAALAAEPTTLCHGDTHVQNVYVLPDGSAGLYDWQLTLRASWARDVAYILGTSLDPATRLEHEQALLEEYLDSLREFGVANPPGREEAQELYAKSMAWGLVIGWLICPPNNYGPEILSANVRRLVRACVDLGTFHVLGVSGAAMPTKVWSQSPVPRLAAAAAAGGSGRVSARTPRSMRKKSGRKAASRGWSARKLVRSRLDSNPISYSVGDRVWSKFADGYWYTATVTAVQPAGRDTTCDILYDDNEVARGLRTANLRRLRREPGRTSVATRTPAQTPAKVVPSKRRSVLRQREEQREQEEHQQQGRELQEEQKPGEEASTTTGAGAARAAAPETTAAAGGELTLKTCLHCSTTRPVRTDLRHRSWCNTCMKRHTRFQPAAAQLLG